MLRFLMTAAALAALCTPAAAGEAADLLRQGLYDGDRAAAAGRLSELAAAGDAEARFAIGFTAFVSAAEGLAADLYSFGLAVPDPGAFGPALGMPLPANPAPEPLTYADFRTVLAAFVDRLDAARELLLQAETGDYVVPVDVLAIRLDIDGNGQGEAEEVVAALLGMPVAAPANPARPTTPPGDEPRAAPAPVPDALEVGFDRADAIWLAGYTHILAAQADFLLAHDFTPTFDAAFHRLFPQAGLPMQEHARGGSLMMDPESDALVADLLAAIHTLSWPVVEPERLRRVRERLQAVTGLSRRNWQAILAETDDDRELLPAPGQTALLPGAGVTEEMVAAWLEALDTADSILAGELLVPHWRFAQGIDLAAYFERATRTDAVMLLTGHDALPFLADGPIASAESFAAANRVFGDSLPNYALWFN